MILSEISLVNESGGSASVQRSRYIDQILVRNTNLGLLACPLFYSKVYLNHRCSRLEKKKIY